MNRKIALALVLAIGCPLVGFAEDAKLKDQEHGMRARLGEVKEQIRFQKVIDKSIDVYRAIVKGPHGEVPVSVLANARCIGILPSVVTGAIVVGGTHGEGLVSCKNDSNTWSEPAPVSINQGSIGLQAGAKSADVVLFIQSKEAVAALKRGNFTLGTDVSAVAGNFDSKADTSAAGVVVYTRAEGLFAGAAVNGGKIGKNEDEMKAYYGKKVDFTALLESRESPDSSEYTKKLTTLFPS